MVALIATIVMITATMAQHLGLTEAIANVVLKVAQCNMCCTFWACMIVLDLCGISIVIAALLSIIMAYTSNWFILLLVWVEKKYHKLWQRLKRK